MGKGICVLMSVSTHNFLKKEETKPTKPNQMGVDKSKQPNLTQLNPTPTQPNSTP